jgi:ribosome-binding protein aMBF1 (putative translation factor)
MQPVCHGDGSNTSITEGERMASTRKQQRDPRRDVLRTLGERVRSLRHQRGLTQERLAHELDLSIAYVSLIERGGRNPPFTTVVSIAAALGVAPRDMCPE